MGVDGGALAILAEWRAFRSRYPVGDGHPLFCTRSGRAVTTAYVRRLLPHLAGLAGIANRVHAHGFRHTHTVERVWRSPGAVSGHAWKLEGSDALHFSTASPPNLSPPHAYVIVDVVLRVRVSGRESRPRPVSARRTPKPESSSGAG